MKIIHYAHRITLEGNSIRRQKTTSHLTGAENGEINRSLLQPDRTPRYSSHSSDSVAPLRRNSACTCAQSG